MRKSKSVYNVQEEEEEKDSLVVDADGNIKPVQEDFEEKVRNSVKTVMSNERGTAAYENEEFVNLQQTLEFELMAENGTLKESNM